MKILILGSGQDAGIPQIGCCCGICERARTDMNYRRFGPSIAVLDEKRGTFIIIDASSDFKYQMEALRKRHPVTSDIEMSLSGILLTHAHMGHCSGLWHLGRESLDAREVPVFCTSVMLSFLKNNHPFSQLVREKNIWPIKVEINGKFTVNNLDIVPVAVPHRNEVAETVGYIMGSETKLAYFPDMDYLTEDIIDIIRSVDIALLDGTFYSRDELDRFDEVPHPPVRDTVKLLGNSKNRIIFTHINHTNPLNIDGKEREYVESSGFEIAADGMIIEI